VIRWDIPQAHHVSLIAKNMRPRDVEEIKVGWGLDADEAIQHALNHSYYARVCFVDMQPLAIYGLSTICVVSQTAQVWIFGTKFIDRHKFSFMKASKVAVRALALHAPRMTNFIDAMDTPAQKWLTAIGGRVILKGVDRGGRVFHQFLLEAPCRRA